MMYTLYFSISKKVTSIGITCCAKEYTIIFDSVELELEYQTSTTKLYEFPLLKEEFSTVGKDGLTTFGKI